ncbi:MAG: Outer membrane protein OprM [Chlamydiia bacterium]|nr:Outer membrane protein OprM [Chlamydiia bacterium]MCH9615904.1 Outer membrane protein OprM [Chlamydiia bacterium]MCH9628693.1 Outer membrane protein OprM [Chlamydiia bacterium]
MRWGFALILCCLCVGCTKGSVSSSPFVYAPKAPQDVWTPKADYKIPEFLKKALEVPTLEGEAKLSELVNIALLNNPETALTWASAREAAANYSISLSDYYPTVDFEADATYQHGTEGSQEGSMYVTSGSTNTGIENETSGGPNASLSYILWDFGQRSSKAETMLQALYAANWGHNEMIQTVMNDVMTAYYDFLYEKEKQISYEADLRDAWTTYLAAKQKLETGVDDISDMLQARTTYLGKQLALTAQIDVVKNSYAMLMNQVGYPSQTVVELGLFPENPAIDQMEAEANQLLALAQEMRPDVKQAQSTVLEMEASLKKAKADLWPTFNVNGSAGQRWYNHGLGNQFSYAGQVSLNYNIFSGFSYINKIRRAEADLEHARIALKQKELSVTQGVITYFNNFETAKELIVYAKEYLEAASEDYTAVFALYQMGTNTIIDVLNAQAALADARTQYIDSKKRLFTSIANLAYATGTLTDKELP